MATLKPEFEQYYKQLMLSNPDKAQDIMHGASEIHNVAHPVIMPTIDELVKKGSEARIASQPGYGETFGKGIIRGTEGLMSGVGSLARWGGDVIGSQTISEAGKDTSDYWKRAASEGWAKPDADTFQGTFMERPSLKRVAGIVGEAVPSLGVSGGATGALAKAGLSIGKAAFGGSSAMGLISGAGTYEEARDKGKSIGESSLYGGLVTGTTTALEATGIGKILGAKGSPIRGAITGGIAEGTTEVLQGLASNIIAKVGYDKTRELSQGLIEGFIGGVGLGAPAGAISSQIDFESKPVKDALDAGVTLEEISSLNDSINQDLSKQTTKEKPTGPNDRQDIFETTGVKSQEYYTSPEKQQPLAGTDLFKTREPLSGVGAIKPKQAPPIYQPGVPVESGLSPAQESAIAFERNAVEQEQQSAINRSLRKSPQGLELLRSQLAAEQQQYGPEKIQAPPQPFITPRKIVGPTFEEQQAAARAKVTQQQEAAKKISERESKRSIGSKVRTIRGVIKSSGGIDFGNFKGELKNMPLVVKKLSKKGGIPIDTIEKTLKEEGWMLPEESLIDKLADDKTFLARQHLSSELKDRPDYEKSSKEIEIEQQEQFQPEEPPIGSYRKAYADELTKGEELTVIHGKGSQGWGKYKVDYSPNGDVILTDGIDTVTLTPFDDIEILEVVEPVKATEQTTKQTDEQTTEPIIEKPTSTVVSKPKKADIKADIENVVKPVKEAKPVEAEKDKMEKTFPSKNIAENAARVNLEEIKKGGGWKRFSNPEAVAEKINKFSAEKVVANTEAGTVELKENPKVQYSTSEEVADFRNANNIPEIKMRKDSSHPTQIATTKSTYRKIFDNVMPKEVQSGKILDYGAGKNIGGKELGADTFEPYPEKGFTPTYKDTTDIPNESYDGVISNAVINVVPDDIRSSIVSEIGRVLKVGGEAYINARGRDVFDANHILINKENMEVIIEATKAYQKGFKQQELTEYISDVLGDSFTVTPATGKNKFGTVGVIAKKNTKSKKLSTEQIKTSTPVTKKDLEALPYVTRVTGKDGKFRLHFKNDISIPLNTVELKGDDAFVFTPQGKQRIRGAFTPGQKIEISQAGDIRTAAHENLHFFESIGLISGKDQRLLNRAGEKMFGIGEDKAELRAKYFEAVSKTTKPDSLVGRIIEKVKEFITQLRQIFGRTVGGVIKDIESGKIFDKKKAKEITEALPQFSTVKNTDTPESRRIKAESLGYDTVLSNLSPDKEITAIRKKNGFDVFDGIFAAYGMESDYHSGKYTHRFVVKSEKVARHGDVDLDYNKSIIFLKNKYPYMSDTQIDRLYELTAEDGNLYDSEDDNPLSEEGYEDTAEAIWELQNIRGGMAADQGFDAIEVDDEFGTSVFIPYGSKAKNLNDPIFSQSEDISTAKDPRIKYSTEEVKPSVNIKEAWEPISDQDYGKNFSETQNKKSEILSDIKTFKDDVKQGLDKALGAISTRLANIDEKLKYKVRKVSLETDRQSKRDIDEVMPMLNKAKEKMSAQDAANWDYARKNSDINMINKLISKYDLRKEYDKHRNILDSLRKQAIDVGLDVGFIENYTPRVLKDSKGFLTALGKDPQWKVISRRLAERAKELGTTVEKMDVEQRADVVSSMLYGGSYGLGGVPSTKQRKLTKIPAELNKFYMDSDAALLSHIYSMRKAIEARKFFGKGPKIIADVKRKLTVATKEVNRFKELTEARNKELLLQIDNLESKNTLTGKEQKELKRLNKLSLSFDNRRNKRLQALNDDISDYKEIINKYKNQQDFTPHIGAYVSDLVINGEISGKDEQQLIDILTARFNEKGMYGAWKAYKEFSYIDTMGSITSALTQIQDLTWAAYEGGFLLGLPRALKAAGKSAIGKSRITREDLGVTRLAEEFSDPGKLGKLLEKTFKWTGLTKMDAIGKEALLNTAFKKFQREAKTDPTKLKEKILPMFEGETDQVIKDLLSDKITDNVEFLVYNRMLDFQPMAMSEMPELYLKMRNGRIFYMLKTFTLKQFDIFRNEAIQKIASSDTKTKIEGFKNLAHLSALFVITGIAADEAKDFVLGRKTDIDDRVMDNILRLAGVSKFLTWKARTEGIGSALSRQILPPFKFFDSAAKDIYGKYEEATTGKEFKGYETLSSVPHFGKLSYWHAGRGESKRDDLWDKRLNKRKTELEDVKQGYESSDNKSEYIAKYRTELEELRLLKKFKVRINKIKVRINRLKSLEETANRKTLIADLQLKRTEMIKEFLKK